MVKEGAQLYTMEGIAAGLIMLLTAYLVLGSTSVYTPGDTHITDMQLEQVGSDILRVMDTPLDLTESLQAAPSNLTRIVNKTDGLAFNESFAGTYLCNPHIVAKEVLVGCSDLRINASIWYVGNTGSMGSYLLPNPSAETYLGIGPGVRVTHWVHMTSLLTGAGVPADVRKEPQEVLVEVVMWKP